MNAMIERPETAPAADPNHATIKQIAEALAIPERTARDRALKGSWPFGEEVLPTGAKRRLYPIRDLPENVRDALMELDLRTDTTRRHARGVTTTEIARRLALAEQGKLPSQLEGWQREVRDARLVLLAEVERIANRCDFKRGRAIDALIEAVASGEAAPDIARQVPAANARDGSAGKAAKGGRTLSRTSLYRWFKVRDEHGPDALAPKAPAEDPMAKKQRTWWCRAFMYEYSKPQKWSISMCLEQMAAKFPHEYLKDIADAKLTPETAVFPSYDQAKRYLNTLSPQQLAKGRIGPRELKQMRAYVARSVANLWPGAVYCADGHTFDAEVAHPQHGQPFRPEVTTVIDVYSRKVVGWSAGVVEKTATVADSMLHAFTTCGPCDIWYVDLGKGFNNQAMDDEVTGLLARVGVLKENSLPYNSQARGVVERAHQSLWIRAAKELPTYLGADMDPEAAHQAHMVTRGKVKGIHPSTLLPDWRGFLEFLSAKVDAYNNRPHSSLPKITDLETGKRRHMTPNEVWAQGAQDVGAPEPMEETEALAAFRPQERRKTARGVVSLWSNSYFHLALEAYHDDYVRVSYDVHDARRVWVYAMDGSFICRAEFEGNKRDFFPVSKADVDQRRRTEGRLRRHERKREEILAEAGPLVIDHQPAQTIELSAAEQLAAEAEFARIERASQEVQQPIHAAPVQAGERPKFGDDVSWAEWVLEHPDQALEEDRRELRRKLRDSSFRMLLEMQGLDVGALSALAA
ncbi:MAG: Mu transposase C-terminal domain-containing protein [Pseudomonadota bacterium]